MSTVKKLYWRHLVEVDSIGKVLTIGNSQAGVIKLAYEKYYKSSINIDFWTMPGGRGPFINIRDGIMFPQEQRKQSLLTDITGYESGVTLNDYSSILISGVGVGALRNINHGIIQENLVAEFLKSIEGSKAIISKQFATYLLEQEVLNSPSFNNIINIGEVFTGNIFVQLFPIPTDLANQKDFDLPYGQSLSSFLSWFCATQLSVIESKLKVFKNIKILKYPEEWYQQGYSPKEYAIANDAWHMNILFGKYLLERLKNAGDRS